MCNKESTKNGKRGDIKERLSCPAAGPNPTAVCALKPKSQTDRPTRQPDGTRADLRRTIDHTKVLTNGEAPKVCQQETVTVTIEAGAKFRQFLPFASPEQISLYNRLREGTEGVHGTAKDQAKIALANPGRRRVRRPVPRSGRFRTLTVTHESKPASGNHAPPIPWCTNVRRPFAKPELSTPSAA